ncbi:hypothetical protein ABVT39_006144 [Epinephelus coioides]
MAMFVQSCLQMDCLASSPGLVAPPKSVQANFAPSSTDALPLRNNTCLQRYLGTPVRWHEVRMGLLFTSATVAAKTPVPSSSTAGVCLSPQKHDKAGKRNFPLTQEIEQVSANSFHFRNR